MGDVKEYLSMGIDELHREVISLVMDDIENGQRCVEMLISSKRYEMDYEFRLVIDTAKLIVYNMTGNYDAIFLLSSDIIERAKNYQMWTQLSLGYNSMGNAYFGLGIYESAIEYYLRTIENEKKHGINDMTSVAYNNMGLIYGNINADEKAYEYLTLALTHLEKAGADQPRYMSKKIQYMSNIVTTLCKGDKLDEVKYYINQLEEMMDGEVLNAAAYSYLFAKMYYAFFMKNPVKGREEYFKAKENIKKEGITRQLLLVIGYSNLCELMGIHYSFYIDELIELEDREEISEIPHVHLFYDILRRYYKAVDNMKKHHDITERYVAAMRLAMKANEEQMLISLETVENLVKKSFDADDISGKNTELKRVAEEAIRNRVALEELFHQVESVNELGRRLTSTTDLPQVINLIYNKIKENIPFEAFVIMVPNQGKTALKSLVNYSFNEDEGEAVIPMDKPGSIFVETFRTGKVILSWDEAYIEKFREQLRCDEIPSAIFIPLIVDHTTIGVFSVQYGAPNTYTNYHLKFLEDAAPYLSIALNNALKSMGLRKEVEYQIEAQEKLKEANLSLQKMSAIDGLTEISRRRVFDEKILEILEDAGKKSKSVAILMIDIDNFKPYNDTYGHLEGDRVLKKVALVFREVMDTFSGLSARFGGEEFIGAISGFTANESFVIAEKIREAVVNLEILHEAVENKRLTVSIGVAIAYQVNETMKSELMRIADESLYKAKNSGKNRVCITEI